MYSCLPTYSNSDKVFNVPWRLKRVLIDELTRLLPLRLTYIMHTTSVQTREPEYTTRASHSSRSLPSQNLYTLQEPGSQVTDEPRLPPQYQ